jgi:hypothetical protein
MAKPKVININPDFSSNPKQGLAMKYLFDTVTTDVAYGGSAGGGKSWLGCAWLIISAVRYPGTRWLMGRSKLKALEETTLVTFFDVAAKWGLQVDEHYKYNSKKNVIVFGNDYGGSIILLKDLFAYPSDPEFEGLGSLELTGAFVDEASQITSKARELLRSRIRYRLDEFCPKCACQRTDEKVWQVVVNDLPEKRWVCKKCGTETSGLLPKMLMTCNPSKNWMYHDFYKPWRDGTLPKNRKFIPALVSDNKHSQSSYIANLQGLTGVNRERLLEGNWEFDEDSFSMATYDGIMDIFVNPIRGGRRFITADIARQGRDKTVVCLWDGLRAERFWVMDKNKTTEAAQLIRDVKNQFSVHWHNVYVDADGVGGGTLDMLPDDVNPIVNNSPPLYVNGERENFGNLKSQLYFYLAEYINNRKIYVRPDENRDKIVQELEWIRQKNAYNDTKFYVIPKDEVREGIGRSPDFLDVLAFRMHYELSNGEQYL